MRRIVKGAVAIGVMVMSGGCSAQPDRFAPGTWELEAWMGVEGQSNTTPRQTDTVKLSPQVAQRDPRSVMFSQFYHGQTGANVIFENGTISGHLDQHAVAPFRAHRQAVSGTYSAEAFAMRIELPEIAGMQSYQFVTGRLMGE